MPDMNGPGAGASVSSDLRARARGCQAGMSLLLVAAGGAPIRTHGSG